MRCEETRALLNAYLDGELDLVRSLDVERHLDDCPGCFRSHNANAALSVAVRGRLPYRTAPAAMKRRVREALRQEGEDRAPTGAPRWRRLALAGYVTVAAAVVLLAVILIRDHWRAPAQPGAGPVLAQEVLASHLRSLMADHIVDVPSTDQHTVKPWFNGRLDFSPTVIDLSGLGFPLAGGRLDYLDGRPVAALVYRHRKHLINLFVWPAAREPDAAAMTDTSRGYHLLHWTRSGMAYWAVSDLNPAELQAFGRGVQGRLGAP